MDKLTKDFHDIVTKAFEESLKSAEQLTKEQLTKCFIEALQSGDFIRHVQHDYNDGLTNSQAVSYLPYRRVMELQSRIRDLEQQLDEALKVIQSYTEAE